MRFLLDTNVVIFSLANRSRLTDRVRALLEEEESHELFVSHVSVWEISAKIGAGRLQLPGGSFRPALQALERVGVKLIPVELPDILAVETLERRHADPFDRVLITQAMRYGLTILTSDDQIPLYAVPVIWK